MISITALTLLLIAYLAGSLSGARVASRIFHLAPPDQYGSKNPGATNVFRLGGRTAGLFTLLFDSVKGIIPVALAIKLELSTLEQIVVALFSVVGHMLPVFHGFRGGKGVATSLGAGLVLAPSTTLILGGCWIVLARITRTSSIASLSCAFAAPLIAWQLDTAMILYFLLITPLIVLRHRENIIKLIRQQESKF